MMQKKLTTCNEGALTNHVTAIFHEWDFTSDSKEREQVLNKWKENQNERGRREELFGMLSADSNDP